MQNNIQRARTDGSCKPFTIMKLIGIVLLCIHVWFNIAEGSKVKNVTSAVVRRIRAISFPEGSGTGIFFAIGIPLDIPDKSVSMAFYFEANYRLPDNNVTNIEDYFGDKKISRKLAYDVIQNKLERAGYPGRSCLLRAICEVGSSPVTKNGLIGDILHILFVPSSSQNEDLAEEITTAEHKKDCSTNYSECPVSLLDLISHYI